MQDRCISMRQRREKKKRKKSFFFFFSSRRKASRRGSLRASIPKLLAMDASKGCGMRELIQEPPCMRRRCISVAMHLGQRLRKASRKNKKFFFSMRRCLRSISMRQHLVASHLMLFDPPKLLHWIGQRDRKTRRE